MISTLSDISPQKRLLNYQEFTPAKIMVGCDINGWLETKKKSPIPQKRKPPKYIHSRFNADKRLKQINNFNQSPQKNGLLSISKLKFQMDALSTKCNIEALSTKCKTSETNDSTTKNIKKIPIIEVNVSSFQELMNKVEIQKKSLKPVEHFFQIQELESSQAKKTNSGSITQRMQQRNRRINNILSCNKVRNGLKQQIQSHNNISRKLSLVNKSQEIINANLSTNQKRALQMIVNNKKVLKIQDFQDKIMPNISCFNDQNKNKIIPYKFI